MKKTTLPKKSSQHKQKQNPGQILPLVLIITTCLITVIIIFIGKNTLSTNESRTSFIGQLAASSGRQIKGEKENRTNILLLGIGGEGHDGAQLTDTIIVISIKHDQKNKKISLISIPRDLYVNLKDQGSAKINNIYSLDKNNNDQQKSNLISKVISDITGLPIHYYIQVDFEGFKKAIDTLGGIDIKIEKSFYDPMYPTENFGYQTITFDQGDTHMDGDLALKYARSRHGIVIDDSGGFEASDVARSKRQQQILFAAKEKAISLNTIINPKKINELLGILGDHVRTNLKLWEIIQMTDVIRNIQTSEIKNNVIDDSPDGLLYSSNTPDGSFIFLPKSNNFLEIHNFCQNLFEEESSEQESVNLEILNGTANPGLASKAVSTMTYENINITNISNADTSDYKKTVIYDYSNNTKPKIIKFLKNRFNAKVVKSQDQPESSPDITLIIGKNFLKLPIYEY